MSARWTEQELEAYLTNRQPTEPRQVPRTEHHASKPTKYKNIPTVGDAPEGKRTFRSKREARLAGLLEADRAAGNIRSWVPEVSLPMGQDEKGKHVRYRADALVIHAVYEDGTFRASLVDVKPARKNGRQYDTATSRAKRAAVRALYGVDVRLW